MGLCILITTTPTACSVPKIYPFKTNPFWVSELELRARMTSNWLTTRRPYWQKLVRVIEPFYVPLGCIPHRESNYGVCNCCEQFVPKFAIPPTWRYNERLWKCIRCELRTAVDGDRFAQYRLDDRTYDMAEMEDLLLRLPFLLKAWQADYQSKPFNLKDFCESIESYLTTIVEVEEEDIAQNESVLVNG